MPLLGFRFGSNHLILTLLSQNIKIFRIPLLGFRFGSDYLILSPLFEI